MQRINECEAPGPVVLLHAGVEPFRQTHDAVQVAHVLLNGQRLAVLRSRQWTVGVRLCQMNQAANFSRLSLVHVASDESVDQSRLPHPRRAFDEQSFEWLGRHCGILDYAALPVATAKAAAV